MERDHAAHRSPDCYHSSMKTTHKPKIIQFTASGQVVIPLWLRKECGIKEGTRALVYREKDAILLKPIAPQRVKNLRGSLKGSGVLKSLMENRKRERELSRNAFDSMQTGRRQ